MLYYIKGRYYRIEQRRKKMGELLRLQLTAFCNHRIEPNAQNVSILMEQINLLNIKEFLPNISSGQTINLLQGTVEPVSNIGFVTADNSAMVMCHDDRIDCIFNFKSDTQGDFEENIENVKDILKSVLQKSEIISNRLAFNINLVSDVYTTDFSSSCFGQSVVLNFYKNKGLKEWSTRQNVWHDIKIDNEVETLNVITEISTLINPPTGEKKLLCHMDINTLREHSDYRFGYKSIDDFVNEVKSIIIEIKNNFEELSNNVCE